MEKFSLKDRHDSGVGCAGVACPSPDATSSDGQEFSEQPFFHFQSQSFGSQVQLALETE